jgi:hypothetical protein
MAGLSKVLACAVLAGLLLAPAAAFGQGRPNALTMTCADVQALLASQGAATLSTGPNTFDRYVAPGTCDGTRVGQPATIATRDTNQCQVHVCAARVRRVD